MQIFVNFLQIYLNILLFERVQSLQQPLLTKACKRVSLTYGQLCNKSINQFGITQQPHQINPQVAIIK